MKYLLSISFLLLAFGSGFSQSMGVKSYSKFYDGKSGFEAVDENLFFGGEFNQIGDINQDGINDIGAIGYVTGDDFIYILLMKADGTIKSQTTIGRDLGGLTGDVQLSTLRISSVTSIGDLNDDGTPDIAFGSTRQLYVLFMKSNGTVDSFKRLSHGQHGVQLDLIEETDFSSSLIGNIDLDGDGNNELIVGDIEYEDPDNRGSIHIFFLNDDGTVKKQTQIKKDPKWGYHNPVGTQNWHSRFGFDVSTIADINNDGIREIIVSSPFEQVDSTQVGAIYCLFVNKEGKLDSIIRRSFYDCNFQDSLEHYSFFGWSVSNIGDLDGNGYEDLIVGAPGTYLFGDPGIINGSAIVLYMKAGFEVDTFLKICGCTQGMEFGPKPRGYEFGVEVSGIGDINGDGMLDIAVGAPEDADAYERAGAIYIINLYGKTYVSTEQAKQTPKLAIYPNPTNGIFQINTKEQTEIKVLNACGQVVWQGKAKGQQTIDASQWQAGMYFVLISEANHDLSTQKLIIQH